jgi:hypothetical protein
MNETGYRIRGGNLWERHQVLYAIKSVFRLALSRFRYPAMSRFKSCCQWLTKDAPASHRLSDAPRFPASSP